MHADLIRRMRPPVIVDDVVVPKLDDNLIRFAPGVKASLNKLQYPGSDWSARGPNLHSLLWPRAPPELREAAPARLHLS